MQIVCQVEKFICRWHESGQPCGPDTLVQRGGCSPVKGFVKDRVPYRCPSIIVLASIRLIFLCQYVSVDSFEDIPFILQCVTAFWIILPGMRQSSWAFSTT
jgi:hypothetical protein